jgi:nicotinate phosphoribosyltransferase
MSLRNRDVGMLGMESVQNITEGILFTDFYELTMAQLYFLTGMHNRQVVFDYFFREYPDYGSHKAGYCINAGLESLVTWMQSVRFSAKEIELLENPKAGNKEPLFKKEFLNWLKKNVNFDSISIRAIPEGRAVHANVPLAQVQGPLAPAQILESSFLNHLNYQILVATKACRIKQAAQRNLTIEFGMRRGHNKGVNAGTRAALIGGADFSSNTGISLTLGLPPKGTHAHSMVQVFMATGQTELDAFDAYSQVYPDDCLLLVDTVDTLGSGIPNAIKVFEKLKKKGHRPLGVRLDSGDLAYLAVQAAKMLNVSGFEDAKIFLSNDLDEMVIWQIIEQIKKEARHYGIDVDHLIKRLGFGVGTRMITSKGKSALDGVYKLAAVRDSDLRATNRASSVMRIEKKRNTQYAIRDTNWLPAIKVSENPSKTINPGYKNVWRIYDNRGKAAADLLALHDENPVETLGRAYLLTLNHPIAASVKRTLNKEQISNIEPLLVDILDEGNLKYSFPSIEQIRKNRDADLEKLDDGVKRLINPHTYHVSLTDKLWKLKQKLISSAELGTQNPERNG